MDNTDPYKTKFKEERLYMSTNQNLMQHMRELIDRIKAADVAYYRDDNPTMTDREYDLLVDELKELETTTGLILSGSPTQTVPGEILKELTPVRHTKPMLSADKTKSVDEMLRFANGRPVVLSWKLDGLTIVLRYEGGEFKQAITRGREGIIGEDVTHRAFLIADFGSAKELAQLLRQIPDERKKKALLCFHWAKYGNFDTGKPFLSQYERNLKVLREYLKEFTE